MRALQIGGSCLQNGAVGQQPGNFLDIARQGRLAFFTRLRMKSLIHLLCRRGIAPTIRGGGNDLR
jgi:hypothetical protein